MKNISRRVFIKGMAVAAAATAASTVLTGCKFPGTETPVVEEPTSTNVLSFVDPDDEDVTLKVTAMELFKGNEALSTDKVSVKLKVENNTGAAVAMGTVASGAADSYCVVVSAYANGYTGDTVVPTVKVASAADKQTTINYVEMDVAKKDSVSLKLTVYKMLANSVTRKMAEQTFTYTL